jgi:adenylate cyclase
VVGISAPLRLYELLGLQAEADPAATERVGSWETALALYETRDFSAAAAIFGSLAEDNPQDGVALLYRDRCNQYIAAPPPEDWDGVNNLTSK